MDVRDEITSISLRWVTSISLRWDVSSLTSHLSHLMSHMSHRTSHMWHLTSHVSHLASHVSHRMSHISQPMGDWSHISHRTSHMWHVTCHGWQVSCPRVIASSGTSLPSPMTTRLLHYMYRTYYFRLQHYMYRTYHTIIRIVKYKYYSIICIVSLNTCLPSPMTTRSLIIIYVCISNICMYIRTCITLFV